MLRFLADENLNRNILRGLLRIQQVDVVRAQEVHLGARSDAEILEWAAGEDRVVLSHELRTMTKCAWQRVAEGVRMPGLIVIPPVVPTVHVLEDLLLIENTFDPADLDNQVWYLPL